MTQRKSPFRRLVPLASVFVAVGLVLSACSSGSATASSSKTASQSSNAIYKMLPASIRKQGYITVATDPQFGPPTNYHPANNPSAWEGVEPDLLRALEPIMGIKFKWDQAVFETIIPGVLSGRYDLGVNALSDTPQREQQVDLVDWWTGVNMVIVKKGNPDKITKLQDLCGKTLAITEGSSDQAFMTQYSSEHCGARGPIQLLTFATRPDCLLALQTGRVAATVGGNGFAINLEYNLDGQQGDASKEYQLLNNVTYAPSPAGIAINKSQTGLRKALMAAIQKLMSDGTYKKIMEKWHWPKAGLMTHPELNEAGKSS